MLQQLNALLQFSFSLFCANSECFSRITLSTGDVGDMCCSYKVLLVYHGCISAHNMDVHTALQALWGSPYKWFIVQKKTAINNQLFGVSVYAPICFDHEELTEQSITSAVHMRNEQLIYHTEKGGRKRTWEQDRDKQTNGHTWTEILRETSASGLRRNVTHPQVNWENFLLQQEQLQGFIELLHISEMLHNTKGCVSFQLKKQYWWNWNFLGFAAQFSL